MIALDSEHRSEYYDVLNSIKSHISHIYDGKILPSIGWNYLNILSQFTDSKQMCLLICQKLLEENSMNAAFKTVIFSNQVENYTDLSNIFNKNSIDLIFDLEKKVNKKDNKKVNRERKNPQVLIIDPTKIEDRLVRFRPDLILIEELNSMCDKKFNNLIKNICTDNYPSAVISFTKLLSEKEILKIDQQIAITHYAKSCFDIMMQNKLTLKIELIRPDIKNSKILDLLDSKFSTNLNKRPLKKVAVIVDDNNLNSLFRYYSKNYRTKYRNLIDVVPYISLQMFSDLYTHQSHEQFLKPNKHKKFLNSAIDNRSEAGIIFLGSNNVDMKTIERLTNIDCLMILDENFKKNKNLYRSTLSCLALNNISNIDVNLIEKEDDNLANQLYRLSEIFYNPNASSMEKYTELMRNIETPYLKIANKLTKTKKIDIEKALNKKFKITIDDKNYHNRRNIIYIVSVLSNENDIDKYYSIEKEFLDTKVSNDQLHNEMELIKTKKSIDYSGPKWIGASTTGEEIPGNRLGFADEDKNIIRVCEIIDVNKFCRRDKRQDWKEKENRDKNILFLSPAIKDIKLSLFKKKVGHSKFKSIEYMSKFDLPLNF